MNPGYIGANFLLGGEQIVNGTTHSDPSGVGDQSAWQTIMDAWRTQGITVKPVKSNVFKRCSCTSQGMDTVIVNGVKPVNVASTANTVQVVFQDATIQNFGNLSNGKYMVHGKD